MKRPVALWLSSWVVSMSARRRTIVATTAARARVRTVWPGDAALVVPIGMLSRPVAAPSAPYSGTADDRPVSSLPRGPLVIAHSKDDLVRVPKRQLASATAHGVADPEAHGTGHCARSRHAHLGRTSSPGDRRVTWYSSPPVAASATPTRTSSRSLGDLVYAEDRSGRSPLWGLVRGKNDAGG
jgi:hypothetical protein